MSLNKNIKKVLLIGSGPIVIGQAAEFDYAGTQALNALKEDNISCVLINSNPATIMTDNKMADKIYIEPLNLDVVKRIIEVEKPDSILSGFGGQTGLTLCMQLAKEGFLKKHNITLLGASPQAIDKAEDRQLFKDAMEGIKQPCIPSKVVDNLKDALDAAKKLGYPIIIRPAFTLGGAGGGIGQNEAELEVIVNEGLQQSPIHQILVEKCVSGWKEIEFEVLRDKSGNKVAVCGMENFDPVGIHTGDSIVVAPTITLATKEYQMLKTAALDIVEAIGIEGGCNVQFALNPDSFEYAVIEVNPRVSRSSALASKATGYPIAKVSAKIALGYNLDEIINSITKKTYASFEPAIDYVVVKMPKWPFDKFVYAKKELGTQMKATGEVMSIGDSFEMALMKAVRGIEAKTDTLNLPAVEKLTDEQIIKLLNRPTDQRIFAIYEAMKRKMSIDKIFDLTKIDRWFLNKIKNILEYELSITNKIIDKSTHLKGKKLGFSDDSIKKISGHKLKSKFAPTYKMVDTCAAEFEASTPYFYATYNEKDAGGENEALDFIKNTKKKTIIVLGSGCIRIGQGIEFDYASVHCVWTLRKMGYNVVIINNNPETVSTDFDVSDRLYFEPLCPEDVMNIIEIEKPIGVVVAFGGQTAIKLTNFLANNNINILGTSAQSIDMAEDREHFEQLLTRIDVKRPVGKTVWTLEEALDAAAKIVYPVLIRPSYVLGGQNMIVAFDENDVKEFMDIILATKIDNPILVDKYIQGVECEVDAIYDGKDILLPGIMEHIERAGIHSGDSIAVYPTQNINQDMCDKILQVSRKLCEGLKVKGIVNIQYIVKNDLLYVIEVNPRASRTVPYLSKVTNTPIIEIATRVALGEKLIDLGYGVGILKNKNKLVAVKVPIFSFEKLVDVDPQLSAEMKSTGEVLGIASSIEEALFKGLLAANYNLTKKGGVIISVRREDKQEMVAIAKKFAKLGFVIYATEGNAHILSDNGLIVNVVNKISQCSKNNILTLLDEHKANYIISTSAKSRNPSSDSVRFRRKATILKIPTLTSIDTANALADSLLSKYSVDNIELVDINCIK